MRYATWYPVLAKLATETGVGMFSATFYLLSGTKREYELK